CLGEDAGAGHQIRIEPAGDPEADDPSRARTDTFLDKTFETGPAAGDRSRSRSDGDRRLAGKSRDREDEALWLRSKVHSPCRTARVLPLVRLRKRASAQRGKNLE